MIVDPETGEEIFLHPETGERLTTQKEWQEALNWLEAKMAPYYRVRRNMREAYARAHPPAEMPQPRFRTSTQEKVARCPRCGGKIEDDLGT